jgi:uncharacterized protein YbgA (DUF1722 family)/uncharacterized protein YbbK (DUF523 family)
MNNPVKKITIGISTCLLGENVRYDGGHKRDPYLVNTLGNFFDYHPVCPETGAGFGIPREAMRLMGDPESPRLVTRQTGRDMTKPMEKWIVGALQKLSDAGLRGFIFKSGSPSSGMERVKVYGEGGGQARKSGIGLFARAFMKRFPLIPVEEEGRMHDIMLRENFIVRVFAYDRWVELKSSGPRPRDIIEFHERHKYLLMAHSPAGLKSLGQLVARVKEISPGEFTNRYETLFMTSLQQHATVRKHVNVINHMAGYFKKKLLPEEKSELLEVIEQYRAGIVPLILPVTLIKHYVRIYGESYLSGQYYLDPHPMELKLRNHA